MSVVISDEILNACGMSATEFQLEIAVMLFQTGKLTLGQASHLAQLEKFEFQNLLKERNIPIYSYDIEDFNLDIKNLKELGRL